MNALELLVLLSSSPDSDWVARSTDAKNTISRALATQAAAEKYSVWERIKTDAERILAEVGSGGLRSKS